MIGSTNTLLTDFDSFIKSTCLKHEDLILSRILVHLPTLFVIRLLKMLPIRILTPQISLNTYFSPIYLAILGPAILATLFCRAFLIPVVRNIFRNCFFAVSLKITIVAFTIVSVPLSPSDPWVF